MLLEWLWDKGIPDAACSVSHCSTSITTPEIFTTSSTASPNAPVLAIPSCLDTVKPVRDALDVLNGKWKLPIIISIGVGNDRFTDLSVPNLPKLSVSSQNGHG